MIDIIYIMRNGISPTGVDLAMAQVASSLVHVLLLRIAPLVDFIRNFSRSRDTILSCNRCGNPPQRARTDVGVHHVGNRKSGPPEFQSSADVCRLTVSLGFADD